MHEAALNIGKNVVDEKLKAPKSSRTSVTKFLLDQPHAGANPNARELLANSIGAYLWKDQRATAHNDLALIGCPDSVSGDGKKPAVLISPWLTLGRAISIRANGTQIYGTNFADEDSYEFSVGLNSL